MLTGRQICVSEEGVQGRVTAEDLTHNVHDGQIGQTVEEVKRRDYGCGWANVIKLK